MKVVSAKEMARVEALSFAAGVDEEVCMERAGEAVAAAVQHFIGTHHCKPDIAVLCGRGNNGGDGYVAGRVLRQGGFAVRAYALGPLEGCSALCLRQAQRFQQTGGEIIFVQEGSALDFGQAEVLIDALLGTGFHGKVEGVMRSVIDAANQSGLPILAIDIPSGLNGTTGEIATTAIRAHTTLFLGLPKVGPFIGEAWNWTGKIEVLDFGLGAEWIQQAQEEYALIDEQQARALLPPVYRTRHKYQAGYVVGVGGSVGMPGAPIMAAYAALRAGAGIVRLWHPEALAAECAAAPYTLIRQGYKEDDYEQIVQSFARATAVFLGPGMGTHPAARKALCALTSAITVPCVLDAEALTLWAEAPYPLPKHTILTPHGGEMLRLLGAKEHLETAPLHKRCQEFVEQHEVVLVLKGAPTFVFCKGHAPYISAGGDPGMATAGSGDVLTGIIAGCAAQMKEALPAALLGVYVHGLAGEYAAGSKTSYAMTALDILEALPCAFHQLSRGPGRTSAGCLKK